MKKTAILILLITMLVSLFTVSVYAAEIVADGKCHNNLKWAVDSDGVLTISGNGAMLYSTEKGEEQAPWAGYADSVRKVVIEEGVTYIEREAFMGFTNLEQVVLPEGLNAIGVMAFADCTALKEVILPDSVESVGWYAFSGCTALEYFTFGSGILSADFVFDVQHPEMKAIYFNGTKEEWETPIRVGLTMHRPIRTLPEGVEVIFLAETDFCGDHVMWTLDKNGVLTIKGNGAMHDFESESAPWYDKRDSIKQIVLQESVTEIGNYAFTDCENLEYVSVPVGMERIGDYAFYGCNSSVEMDYDGTVAAWNKIKKGEHALPDEPDIALEEQFVCEAVKVDDEISVSVVTRDLPEAKRFHAVAYDESGKLVGVKTVTQESMETFDADAVSKIVFYAWGEDYSPVTDVITQEIQ